MRPYRERYSIELKKNMMWENKGNLFKKPISPKWMTSATLKVYSASINGPEIMDLRELELSQKSHQKSTDFPFWMFNFMP